MALTIPTAPTNNGTFTPIPADNHVGVCIGVIDLGTHSESFQGGPPKTVRKVKIVFELPEVTKPDGQTATISKTYNLSMHEKSGFRKDMEAWIGAKALAENTGKGLDFLLERGGLVNVEEGTDKADPNRKFSFVKGISKLPKGMPEPHPTRDTFILDLDSKFLPPELSAYDAERIRVSREYLAGGFTDEAPRPDAGKGYSPRPTTAAPAAPGSGSTDFDETDESLNHGSRN